MSNLNNLDSLNNLNNLNIGLNINLLVKTYRHFLKSGKYIIIKNHKELQEVEVILREIIKYSVKPYLGVDFGDYIRGRYLLPMVIRFNGSESDTLIEHYNSSNLSNLEEIIGVGSKALPYFVLTGGMEMYPEYFI